ncbi:MAG: DUF2207 domain-containing protein [Nitrospiraceae bacterium]
MWLLAALALILLTFAHALPADARSFVISRFDVQLTVTPDGELLVTETVSPRFEGSWNGIQRQIPVEYHTPQGFNYSLLLDHIEATDEQGASLKVELSRDRHYRNIRVWIPGAVDATRTFILKYRVRNGLKFFEEHDELYWNVTGDEWDVPIEHATARILLPTNTTGIRALTFTGAYGAREHAATVEIAGPTVEMKMMRQLGFREGLTAVIGWDKGIVRGPTALEQSSQFASANWPFAIPLVTLVGMLWLWYSRGRDPRLRTLTVAYEPPDRLTPAEVGTLIDESPDLRDITATVVDLAVRGFLRIDVARTEQMFGLWTSTEYSFHRLKPSGEWESLPLHEQLILKGIFRHNNDEVPLSALENTFYSSLSGIQAAIFQQLQQRHYYTRRPDLVKQAYLVGGFILGLVLTIGLGWWAGLQGMAPLPALVAGPLSGLIVILVGRIMPARTLKGTRALEGIRGFEEFLTRVEGDRIERVVKTPELFERFLPFAMALGVEKNWARAFESILTAPPSWYGGSNLSDFNSRSFLGQLDHMTRQTGSTMTSAPRSSGGSGFSSGSSGGGSSGGGFGGGGGSGF